jgi:hypothetical protein
LQFDSKVSPLALLAQTCSAIGSDSPNQSKLLANIEKSNKAHKDARDKGSPGSNSSMSNGSSSDTPKSSFKPYEANVIERNVKSPRVKSPKSLSATITQNGRCESNQSASSSRASPSNLRKTPSSMAMNGHSQEQRNASPLRASSKDRVNSTLESPSGGTAKLTDSIKDLSTGVNSSKLPISSASLSATTSVPPFYGYPGYPMDLMTASALLNSPHHQMLKAAAMNPYFNYSKLKVPGAADSMICRDPYCTGCALSSHMLNKTGSSCPAGCTQCDHPGSKSYSQALSAAGQQTAAMYAHAQLAALAAASQMPYVCNWIGGDTSYCGKRFSTSDELFSHLRTAHAASTAAMSEALLNPAASALPPTHPLFQRTYPTPPLSPLSTARYHPYSKPPLLPPSLQSSAMPSLPMPPHPSLAQYFSPYSFYAAARLGAPSMHP